MATPNEKFVESLKVLQRIQDNGDVAIHITDIPNKMYRDILIKNGFIKPVIKGWYIATNPEEKQGDTTSWYGGYWNFCIKLLEHSYGKEWCLSANQSLLFHAGNRIIPQQLLVRSPKANNLPIELPHGATLFNLRLPLPPKGLLHNEKGLRMYNLPSALIHCSSKLFINNAIDARSSLLLIRDASELLPILLEGGHSTIAGRLAGAFRNIERPAIADQIIDTMKQAGYQIREADPFERKIDINISYIDRSPYVNRFKLMWIQMREEVLRVFPKPPGLAVDHETYLKKLDEIYVTDAYHSLSIERYKVTPELIAKVAGGTWNTIENKEDKKLRDTMAARGYYQAFLQVKETIVTILNGVNPGKQASLDHSKWYRELFDPSIVAGILKVQDLAGYRNHQVYIGNSKHVLLDVDAMRDTMPILFELLENEPEPSVRAVLGHFIFVFIHPYMDGNGRMGRFLMNAMLASGGYPWTVIPLERRNTYMAALETASVEQNIIDFAKFVGQLVKSGMEEHPEAKLPRTDA